MNINSVLESLLFVAGDGITKSQLSEILEISAEELQAEIERLKQFYAQNERGLTVSEYDEYVQLKTVEEHYGYITRLAESKRKQPLSVAALETLSIVAYHQPVTRASIEFIRGVSCDGPMSKLIERGLIEENGRLDAPGRPILYVTTKEFLRSFGLSSLADLPDTEELEDALSPAVQMEIDALKAMEEQEKAKQAGNESAAEPERTENAEAEASAGEAE